jgi:hypothetical protein
MKIAVRNTFGFAAVAIAMLTMGTLTGCSNGPGAPATTPLTAAKNMYVIQPGETNSVETDSVLMFSTTATGATMPGSTLSLPSGYYAYSLAVGPTGKLYVGGEYGDDPSQILVFAAGATGAAAPIASYTGGTPGTFDYADYMTVNDKGQLFIFSDDQSIEVYAANAAAGDLPAQYITTYVTNDDWSDGIAADSVGNIYLISDNNDAINMFAAGATGNAAPAQTITGTATSSFTNLFAITADSAGNVMVANYNQADDPFGEVRATPQSSKVHLRHDPRARRLGARSAVRPHTALPPADTGLFVFAAGASGNATPTSTISGSTTTVNEPESMTCDALDNIYYMDYEGGALTIMTFAAGATGNVAPNKSITSTAFTGGYGDPLVAY